MKKRTRRPSYDLELARQHSVAAFYEQGPDGGWQGAALRATLAADGVVELDLGGGVVARAQANSRPECEARLLNAMRISPESLVQPRLQP